MKYVGVSAPAWTIAGKWKEPEMRLSQDDDLLKAAPAHVEVEEAPVVRTGVRAPTIPRQRQERSPPPIKERHVVKPPPVRNQRKPVMITNSERFPVSKEAAFGPGPTSYQHDLFASVSSKMPNFSFGYRFEEEQNKSKHEVIEKPPPEDDPIPGLYYPKYLHKEMARGVKIPKASKDALNLLSGSSAPGPGKYVVKDLPGNTSSKKGTFGTPKPKKDSLASTKDEAEEGQFHYDPDMYKKKVKPIVRSVSEKFLPKKTEVDQPQPPTYYGTGIFEAKGPKWGFGKGNRPPLNSSTQTNLGPGEYIGLGMQKKPFDPATSFPTLPRSKRRPLNDNNKVPGPGTYPLPVEEDDEIGQRILNKPRGLAFSMRQKLDVPGSKDYLRQPGPGQYEVHNLNCIGSSSHYQAGPVYGTFGSSSRNMADGKKKFDGPDMLNLAKDLGSDQGIKFPKSKRKPLATTADPDIDIGPGYYDLKPTVPQIQPFEQDRLDRAKQFNLNLI